MDGDPKGKKALAKWLEQKDDLRAGRTPRATGDGLTIVDKPIRYGPTFKRPSKKVLRKERIKNGVRMFEPAAIRRILDASDVQMRAMVLLAINGGLGNTDCGALTVKALDLENRWLKSSESS